VNDIDDAVRRELSDAPPVPEHLFGSIERTVIRQRRIRRGMLLFAVVGLCAAAVWLGRSRTESPQVANQEMVDEIDDELLRIGAFVNGAYLEEELPSYVVPGDF